MHVCADFTSVKSLFNVSVEYPHEMLNRLIKDEFGKDDGSELPDLPGVTWTIDRIDM